MSVYVIAAPRLERHSDFRDTAPESRETNLADCELHSLLPDLNSISMVERVRCGDPAAIDVRAVVRAGVRNPVRVVLQQDLGVCTRDGWIAWVQILPSQDYGTRALGYQILYHARLQLAVSRNLDSTL